MKEMWRADAREFGRFVKKGGWYVAYLAAHRVKEGNGQGTRSDLSEHSEKLDVCSTIAFAKEAGLSDKTVTAYLKTWDRAAASGVVPPRSGFVGKEHNVPLPDDEVEPWEEWHTAVANAGRNIKDDDPRRAALIAQANTDGVGASKVLDVASNKRAVIAAVKADPALAAAIAADDEALLAVHREDNKRHTADGTPRRKQEADREPLTVSDALVMIGVNADLRTVLDRATAAAADGKGYAPEMREAMVQALDETMTLAEALRDVLTGKLGQPVTDEALAALMDEGVA